MVDATDIVTGRAQYGLDVWPKGALVAVVARCPYFDGGIQSWDASATKAIPGVRDVLVLPGPQPGEPFTANLATGIAVLADDTWSALRGREAVGDDHDGSALHEADHGRLDQRLGARVEARRGLVEHEEGRIDERGPGQRHELLLAGRQA